MLLAICLEPVLQAMAALRARLLSQMAAAHPEAGGAAAASAAGPSVQTSSTQSSRGRVFDSDEYDLSALETGTELESVDEIAQEAAHKLAANSHDIADHIIAEHQDDHMIDDVISANSRRSSAVQQQQQQQLGRGANKSKQQRPSGEQPSSRPSSRAPGSSSSSSSSCSGSGSSKRGKLAGDTAIGRVAEALQGVPVVVLRKGKARLFEAGAPMVSG
jgi:hypothetical protein